MIRAALACLLLQSGTPAPAASPIAGQWTNQPAENMTVRIDRCGAVLCGRVTDASPRARAEAASAGTPQLIGAELMSGLEPAGERSWRGRFFVPQFNLRGKATVRLVGADALDIHGCALAGLLCRTQRWTRVVPAPAETAGR